MSSSPPSEKRSFDKLTLLRNHPLFGGLEPATIERLAAYATTRVVEQGTMIFGKGDPGTSLFAILSGTMKISVFSVAGREAVFNVIYPGEIFGEIALLDGRPRTADAIAMTDCQLMEIDRRNFVPFVRANPEVALRVIELLCARLRWTSEHFEEVMFLDLPGRLAKTLLRLADRGAPGDEGRITITQREISQLVGMSREAVNKQLRAWENRHWVELERNGVQVRKPAELAAIAAADFEPDLA